jgi:hypothetical protein
MTEKVIGLWLAERTDERRPERIWFVSRDTWEDGSPVGSNRINVFPEESHAEAMAEAIAMATAEGIRAVTSDALVRFRSAPVPHHADGSRLTKEEMTRVLTSDWYRWVPSGAVECLYSPAGRG